MGLFIIIARSSASVVEFIIILDVPSVYPYFPFCKHRRSDSRNIMNKYGLRVSPSIVPLCIGIFLYLTKVFTFEYFV